MEAMDSGQSTLLSRNDMTVEAVREMYHDNLLSQREIGEHYNTNQFDVSRFMRENGIETRTKSEVARLRWARMKGESVDDISELYGADSPTGLDESTPSDLQSLAQMTSTELRSLEERDDGVYGVFENTVTFDDQTTVTTVTEGRILPNQLSL